jgi:hypothetical protein
VEAGTFAALRSSRALAIGTSVRIAASPIILALLLSHDWTVAAVLFLVAAATDFIDGRLARRWQVTTKLGLGRVRHHRPRVHDPRAPGRSGRRRLQP